jgi:hypothetical protein
VSYSDQLDPDQQIGAEEWIAGQIFDFEEDNGIYIRPDEEQCAEMGRRILRGILARFRPDLVTNDARKDVA